MNSQRHRPSQEQTVSRRALLKRAAGWSAGLSAAWLLAACGGERADASLAQSQGGSNAETACAKTDDLSPQELARRKGVAYVDAASDPARRCATCRFFKPDGANGGCGRCEIIPGGVAETGYCTAWAAH